MDKRILELIYEDYLNEIKKSPDEEIKKAKYEISSNLKNEILDKFLMPIKEKKPKEQKIKDGNMYLFFKEHIPIYFSVYKQVDENLYEVLKLSNYWELSNQNDLITKINDEIFAVETWNSFYLTKEEIENAIYYGQISKEDFEILKQFKEEKIQELPEEKRGLKVPIGENIQTRFHEKESELVRDYKFRIFADFVEETVLEIPPEREKEIKLPLIAGKEKTLVRKNNFILKKNKENQLIEIIFSPEIVNKKAKLKYFDELIEFEKLPERIFIETIEIENIDLEKLAQNIEVEV